MRAVLAQLDDFFEIVRFEDEQAADHFTGFGVGAVGNPGLPAAAAHHAALAVGQLVAGYLAPVLLNLLPPGHIALDDGLDFFWADVAWKPGVVQEHDERFHRSNVSCTTD